MTFLGPAKVKIRSGSSEMPLKCGFLLDDKASVPQSKMLGLRNSRELVEKRVEANDKWVASADSPLIDKR